MTHDLFGKLKYKERDESWAGSAILPRFAAVGNPPEAPEMTEEEAEQAVLDMNSALENMKEMMRERFGDGVAEAFEALERETEEEIRETEESPGTLDPKEEEREARRAASREKRTRLLAKGKFPIRVAGMEESEPTPSQEASFRFLLNNEQTVFDAVTAQILASYQNFYEDENWRKIMRMKPVTDVAELKSRFGITRLDISQAARNGFAHFIFIVESDWEDDHGLLVVYSPDTQNATWTTWDGFDELLESDEPDMGQEYVPSPHDELLEAILTGDEVKARELVAAGADINALGLDEYPPLWISVDQIEVEEVRRLLAFGADSTLMNPDENTTPLKHAKRMYRDMGFAPSKKKRDPMMNGLMSVLGEAMGSQMNDIKSRLETIIKMLEDAGGK